MDAIQIQMLSERLRIVREQACAMYYTQHPVGYDDYEVAAMLNDLGAQVRKGQGISHSVTFPPTVQHEANEVLRDTYRRYTERRMGEILEQATDMPAREMTGLVMQYTSDVITYKPQILRA